VPIVAKAMEAGNKKIHLVVSKQDLTAELGFFTGLYALRLFDDADQFFVTMTRVITHNWVLRSFNLMSIILAFYTQLIII